MFQWENIKVSLKTKGMELTDAIIDYVVKRVTNLGKLLKKIQESGGEVFVYFEIGKETSHHNKGFVFVANCNITIDGKNYYSSSEKEDLYEAIDDCKEQMFLKINKERKRKEVLIRKGARKVKEFLRRVF